MKHSILLLSLVACAFAINNRPIIGILTQPTSPSLRKYGDSYIAASYVKYVEGGGGRVVPIFHNSTIDELDRIFNSINGVLFPGGGADLDNTPLFKAGQYLYSRAIKAHDKGEWFPIVGHCMGFELLALITSDDQNILSQVDCENISMPLQLNTGAKSSRWLRDAPARVMDTLTNKPVTLNNHEFGVTPSDYNANSRLAAFYNVLSTNIDRKGKRFISLWEGKDYPIYGAQWHAEKPQYEWNPNEDINHSVESIEAMQYFAQFLVNESRKNNHKFATSVEEYDALIYNYNPIYSASIVSDFEQVYVF